MERLEHKGREKRDCKRRLARRIMIVFAVNVSIVAAAFTVYVLLNLTGRASLLKKGGNAEQMIGRIQGNGISGIEPAEGGGLKYKGHIYRYKEEMITILCIGVDREGNLGKTETSGEGEQAEMIFLLALDGTENRMSLIGVSMDMMTDIKIRDNTGDIRREESCELVKEAVSNLFYGQPIHGYFAIDMEAIDLLNDMVGGVEVTPEDDFTKADLEMTKGKASALSVYSALSWYKATDIDVNEAAYLATLALECDFTEDSIKNVAGMSEGKDACTEYEANKKALYEMILDVFYERVS